MNSSHSLMQGLFACMHAAARAAAAAGALARQRASWVCLCSSSVNASKACSLAHAHTAASLHPCVCKRGVVATAPGGTARASAHAHTRRSLHAVTCCRHGQPTQGRVSKQSSTRAPGAAIITCMRRACALVQRNCHVVTPPPAPRNRHACRAHLGWHRPPARIACAHSRPAGCSNHAEAGGPFQLPVSSTACETPPPLHAS